MKGLTVVTYEVEVDSSFTSTRKHTILKLIIVGVHIIEFLDLTSTPRYNSQKTKCF